MLQEGELKHMTYKICKEIFFTEAGANFAAQCLQSRTVVNNREKVLRLLKRAFVALKDTIYIESLNSDSGIKCPKEPCPKIILDEKIMSFWGSLVPKDHQNEKSIESYFIHPQIEKIYKHILAIEDSWQKNDLESFYRGASPVGYVYAAWNSLFAGLIKIGATKRTPQIRVQELSSSGIPEPFEVVTSIPSTNPFLLEREIHRHFHAARKYGMKKEFFSITKEEVILCFEKLAVKAMNMESKKRKIIQRKKVPENRARSAQSVQP